MAQPSQSTSADGAMSWEGGVNSLSPTTIADELNPGGLRRNELAWMINCITRDGGISPRGGYQPKGNVHDSTGLFQGGYVYEPRSGEPYLIVSISGHILRVILNPYSVTDLSVAYGLVNSATEPLAHFVQAEEFLIIQVGDNATLPLFWDGTTLRRSNGLTGAIGTSELPPATSMDYYMGRVWYAQFRMFSAGDIVGGSAGTPGPPYYGRDAVLKVTENPLAFGGDGFTVPDNAGNIRAIWHNANLNTQLGQGILFVGTRRKIYSMNIPVTRTDWIAADSNNQPQQNVVQIVNGPVSDRSVVGVNGDSFYQSLEPGIRSLISAIRDFSQWSNTSLSANENRVLQFTNRALLQYSSGIAFDNRLLQTTLPRQIPQGVVHDAVIPLDFMPVSRFRSQVPPAWQGVNEGLQILQMFTMNFGGLERSYALMVSKEDSSINIWEMTLLDRLENGEGRITWIFETPAFNWNKPFELKKLVGAELWIDRLWGTVEIKAEYRSDGETCWKHWHQWKICSAKNSCEDANNPICYPVEQLGDSYRQMMSLPKPPEHCNSASGRPSHIGYQFQVRFTLKGYCRVRSIILHAEPVEKKLYYALICPSVTSIEFNPAPATPPAAASSEPCSPLVPSAPSNLVLTVLSPLPGGDVDLTWELGDGTHNQEIWRSIAGDITTFTKLATVGPSATAYSDVAVAICPVAYKVIGRNACGYSEFSAISQLLGCDA